jgi:hypothetical protein
MEFLAGFLRLVVSSSIGAPPKKAATFWEELCNPTSGRYPDRRMTEEGINERADPPADVDDLRPKLGAKSIDHP